jgi:osmotically-inducible protein OsmY
MPLDLLTAIEPAPGEDLRLERAARLALQGRCERAVRGLAVRVDEGVVTLRGHARSFYEKQLVLHAVQKVGGLTGIVDEVTVTAGSRLG